MAEHADTYPVSEQTRREVWSKCYSAEYAERYYQLLANRYLKHHRRCTFGTIVLGGGAIIPAALAIFSDLANPLIGAALGLAGVLLAGVSVVSLVGDFGRKAAVTTFVARTCGRAARELRDLLNVIDLNRVDEDQARAELTALATLVANETYNTEAIGIDVDNEDDDSEKAERETREHLENLYAS